MEKSFDQIETTKEESEKNQAILSWDNSFTSTRRIDPASVTSYLNSLYYFQVSNRPLESQQVPFWPAPPVGTWFMIH